MHIRTVIKAKMNGHISEYDWTYSHLRLGLSVVRSRPNEHKDWMFMIVREEMIEGINISDVVVKGL